MVRDTRTLFERMRDAIEAQPPCERYEPVNRRNPTCRSCGRGRHNPGEKGPITTKENIP